MMNTSSHTPSPVAQPSRPARADSVRTPVDKQRAAYNAHDLDAFLACYAPDVLVYDSDGRITAENRAQMKETYKTLFARSPEVRLKARRCILLGSHPRWVAIDEEHVSGYVSGGQAQRYVMAVMYEFDRSMIHVVRFLTPPYPKVARPEHRSSKK